MGKRREIEKESKRLLSFLRQKTKGDDEHRLARYLDELLRIYKIRKLQPEAEKILKDLGRDHGQSSNPAMR